jgi:hypothetical protein
VIPCGRPADRKKRATLGTGASKTARLTAAEQNIASIQPSTETPPVVGEHWHSEPLAEVVANKRYHKARCHHSCYATASLAHGEVAPVLARRTQPAVGRPSTGRRGVVTHDAGTRRHDTDARAHGDGTSPSIDGSRPLSPHVVTRRWHYPGGYIPSGHSTRCPIFASARYASYAA